MWIILIDIIKILIIQHSFVFCKNTRGFLHKICLVGFGIPAANCFRLHC